MTKLKIVIDLDSTILDTGATLYKIYQNDKGVTKKYHTDYDWNFNNLIPKEDLPYIFSLFIDKRLYADEYVTTIPNSISIINKLSEKHEVIIATKHREERISNTLNWVNKVIPNVKIVFLSSFDKSEITIDSDLFIDDRLDALNSSNANFNICFGDYQWNKEWTGIKITDWYDIERFVNSLK